MLDIVRAHDDPNDCVAVERKTEDELMDERKQLLGEIDEIEDYIAEITDQIDELMARRDNLENQRNDKENSIDKIDAEMKETEWDDWKYGEAV